MEQWFTNYVRRYRHSRPKKFILDLDDAETSIRIINFLKIRRLIAETRNRRFELTFEHQRLFLTISMISGVYNVESLSDSEISYDPSEMIEEEVASVPDAEEISPDEAEIPPKEKDSPSSLPDSSLRQWLHSRGFLINVLLILIYVIYVWIFSQA